MSNSDPSVEDFKRQLHNMLLRLKDLDARMFEAIEDMKKLYARMHKISNDVEDLNKYIKLCYKWDWD